MKTLTEKKLRAIAARVVWWKKPEETLANPYDFLCRAMVWGTWQDCLLLDRLFGKKKFIEAIQHAPPGVFTPKTWRFWQLKLGIDPKSALPVRSCHCPTKHQKQ